MAKRGTVYNKIYTPELWEQVNPINKEIMDDYMIEIKSNKLKESTIKQYYNDLRIILIYILTELGNKNILDLNKKHFRNMVLWMIEKNMSNARCNRMMSAVRSMLDFCENDDDYEGYESNPSKKVKGLQKEGVREVVFLTDEQIFRLRNKLKELGKYKYMLLVDISYDSAGRRNEIAQVMKDGLLERGYTNIVIGKRGKKFPLIFHDRTKESLKLYLDQRGEDDIPDLWVIGEDNEDKTSKRPASYENLYDWMMYIANILSELEGTTINLTNHSFRHCAVENLKNGSFYMCEKVGRPDGFSLDEIAIVCHHESVEITKSYAKNDDNNVLQTMFGIVIE